MIGGFAFTIAATVIFPVPFGGCLSFLLAPVAALLLLVGGLVARNPQQRNARASFGMTSHTLGAALIMFATIRLAFTAEEIEHAHDMNGLLPEVAGDWALALVISLCGAALLSLGLAMRTGMTTGRAVIWGCAAFAVTPATLLLLLWAFRSVWTTHS